MNGFDLIEYQQYAREKKKPKELFDLWEDVCKQYDRGIIGQYELDEMKAVIWPQLKVLTALKHAVDRTFVQEQTAA